MKCVLISSLLDAGIPVSTHEDPSLEIPVGTR